MKLDTFFSCSFSDEDREVNDFFKAVAEGMGFDLANVSGASTETPPNVARAKIEEADCLVAVCTKRDELKRGGFQMPQAVHDEISFAFAAGTPMLMFVEEGVQLAGFKTNFGTYQAFSRDQLTDANLLRETVRALYSLRCKVSGEDRIGSQGISDSIAEYVHHLVELRHNGGEYVWQYSTTKKLVFKKESKRSFSSGVWSTVPAKSPDDAHSVEWQYQVKSSSHDLTLVAEIEKKTPSCIEVQLRPHPVANDGDYIEYATISRGRYINALWDDEVAESSMIHLDDCDKHCADGLILIHRTKKAVIEFRFPAEYGLSKKDVRPFVGSYTNLVDYEVPSELERSNLRVEEFAGSVTVRMEVESPLLGHMYGVAWDPKERPKVSDSTPSDEEQGRLA